MTSHFTNKTDGCCKLGWNLVLIFWTRVAVSLPFSWEKSTIVINTPFSARARTRPLPVQDRNHKHRIGLHASIVSNIYIYKQKSLIWWYNWLCQYLKMKSEMEKYMIGVLPIPEAPPVTSADKPALISIIFVPFFFFFWTCLWCYQLFPGDNINDVIKFWIRMKFPVRAILCY